MVDSFIDGAAILGTTEALSAKRPDHASIWAFHSAVEVTAMLIVAPRVRLSPIPELHSAAIGPYGAVLSELGDLVAHVPADDSIRQSALTATKQWARTNTATLSAVLKGLKQDDNYTTWIEWLAENQWSDHARRHGGLFEKSFVPLLSRVLDVEPDELVSLRAAVGERELHNLIVGTDDRRSQLVRDAFTVSTLLRGRYYESVTKKLDSNILHHPIRYRILPTLPSAQRTRFQLPNTAWFLSILLISAAFNARRSQRAAEWAKMARETRAAVASGSIDVGMKITDEVALKVAVRSARDLGWRAHPAWVDLTLGTVVSTGLGGLSSFYLDPYSTVAVAAATEVVLKTTNAISGLSSRVSRRETRLEYLGRTAAGRLSADWRS